MQKNLWQQTLNALELELDPAVISTWFKKTTLFETSEDKLVIACPDSYSKNVIQGRYADKVHSIMKELNGGPVKLDFIVKPTKMQEVVTGPLFDEAPTSSPYARNTESTDPSTQSEIQTTGLINPRYTLENFVVGVSNRVVHAAAMSVVETPGGIYNPLFIYGSTGVGKTHLLHAIGNALKERNPNYRITYTSTEEFVNDMILHIRQKKEMQLFRTKYRQSDVLLIDDIQFLSGKDSSQEEFYHTFNTLHQAGNQIVIASDREPSQIAKLADRLVSRFRGGLMTQISPPDYETRMAIISAKAHESRLQLSQPVIEFLASQGNNNIRELQGMLLKVQSYAISHNQPINLALVRSLFDPNSEGKPQQKRITPQLILDLVTTYFDTSIKDLCGRKRNKNIVIPRQLTMFLLRNELGMNLAEIGSILGGRDHTTVMHGCSQVKRSIEDKNDLILRSHLLAIRQELYS